MAVQDYDLAGYEGPSAILVDANVVRRDRENYGNIKVGLIKNGAGRGGGDCFGGYDLLQLEGQKMR